MELITTYISSSDNVVSDVLSRAFTGDLPRIHQGQLATMEGSTGAPLGRRSREVYRPSDGRPRGREEVAVPFGPHTNSQRTRSPSSFAFPPSTSLFSIMLVSHPTKVVHNKAGDIQFLISDLTGDCGFLISILDP